MQSGSPIVEQVMQAIVRADVLKPDEPDYPTHYNRAYCAVAEALTVKTNLERVQQEQTTGVGSLNAGVPVSIVRLPPWLKGRSPC